MNLKGESLINAKFFLSCISARWKGLYWINFSESSQDEEYWFSKDIRFLQVKNRMWMTERRECKLNTEYYLVCIQLDELDFTQAHIFLKRNKTKNISNLYLELSTFPAKPCLNDYGSERMHLRLHAKFYLVCISVKWNLIAFNRILFWIIISRRMLTSYFYSVLTTL